MELENRIKRAVVLADGKRITNEDLGLSLGDKFHHVTLKEAKDVLKKEMIIDTLNRLKGNITKSAEVLGICRPTMYDLMEKHAIHN